MITLTSKGIDIAIKKIEEEPRLSHTERAAALMGMRVLIAGEMHSDPLFERLGQLVKKHQRLTHGGKA